MSQSGSSGRVAIRGGSASDELEASFDGPLGHLGVWKHCPPPSNRCANKRCVRKTQAHAPR